MLYKNNLKRLNLLFLIDEFSSDKGGSEQHLLWLLTKLPSDLFFKKLIVFSNILAFDPDKFPVTPDIFGEIYGHGWRSLKARFFALVRYIRDHKIDIVHAFTPRDELVAVLACWVARRGSICGHRRNVGYALDFWKILQSKIVQLFKIKYIANSESAKNVACQREKINSENIKVIYNPIYCERSEIGFSSKLSKCFFEIPDNALVVGMVATVRPIKGYEVLLFAAKGILKKFPNTFFLCIGEQEVEYLDKLKNIAKDLNIQNRIIWYGEIDNPFRILHFIDVAVLSSHSESFSNSVLEYAIAKKAIVATRVGGMNEIIIDGFSGYLVPSNNSDLLCDRIVKLLEDTQKRDLFATNVHKFVFENFSEQIILPKYINFYNKVHYLT